jgi:hypothetical protein
MLLLLLACCCCCLLPACLLAAAAAAAVRAQSDVARPHRFFEQIESTSDNRHYQRMESSIGSQSAHQPLTDDFETPFFFNERWRLKLTKIFRNWRALSVLMFFCTLFWFLSLNDRAFKEYISENAMLVGAASPRTRIENIRAFLNQAYSTQFSEPYDFPLVQPESSGLFACSHVPCRLCSHKLSVCLASSRSDGKDALLLVARTPSPKCALGMNRASALEASIATSVAEHASSSGWLGRDVYVVLVPCECSLSDSLANWLHVHHESPFDFHLPFPTSAPAFWAGMIISIQHPSLELVNIQNIGNRGRLTNLDVVYAATWTIKSQGLAFDIERNLATLKKLSGISVPKSSLTLSSFILSQARGTSSGAHGHLLDRQIEAITLQAQAFSGANATDEDWIMQPNAHKLHKYASSVELLLRTQSNVLERYHQSYFYYAISDLSCTPDGRGCYIPISHYLLVVGFLMLPLVLATFNFTLQISDCDWMLCWMVHGASALFSLTLLFWISHASVTFSAYYSSVYILVLCSFLSLLIGNIIASRSIAFVIRLIPHANLQTLCVGLDTVALVNALAIVTYISISNGAQGLVAAFIISPLVRASACSTVQLHNHCSHSQLLLTFFAALSRRSISPSIGAFLFGISCQLSHELGHRFC